MNPMPTTVPISDLRQRQNEILSELSEGPVLLTQHGRAAAVLVDPEQWNRLLDEFEDMYLALEAVEAQLDDEPTIDFEEYLAKRGEYVSSAAET